MRLLDTTTFELRLDSQDFFQGEGHPILSHRWVGREVTFDEIKRHAPSLRAAGEHRMKSAQLDKIRGHLRERAQARAPVDVDRQLLHQQVQRD